MGSLRRNVVVGTTAVVTGVVGTAWAVLGGDSDGDDTGAHSSSSRSPPNATDGSSSGNERPRPNTTATSNGSESTYPDAANPAPNPDVETNDSVIANASEVGRTEPTTVDVAISNTRFSTGDDVALEATATNNANVAMTVDLRIVFLNDTGDQVTYRLTGVTSLEPGETWDFSATVRGSKADAIMDYRIEKTVSVR